MLLLGKLQGIEAEQFIEFAPVWAAAADTSVGGSRCGSNLRHSSELHGFEWLRLGRMGATFGNPSRRRERAPRLPTQMTPNRANRAPARRTDLQTNRLTDLRTDGYSAKHNTVRVSSMEAMRADAGSSRKLPPRESIFHRLPVSRPLSPTGRRALVRLSISAKEPETRAAQEKGCEQPEAPVGLLTFTSCRAPGLRAHASDRPEHPASPFE